MLSARQNLHFNTRCVRHAQRAVVVKVALPHASILDRDAAVQRGRQGKSHAAFDLLPNDVRIDGKAAIDRADNTRHAEGPVSAHRDFRDLRDDRSERFVQRDTSSGSYAICRRRQRGAPSCAISRAPQHGRMTRMFREQRQSERNRILLRRRRDFIHEALGEERLMRMPDAAPESDRHGQLDNAMRDARGWILVRLIVCAFNDGLFGREAGKVENAAHHIGDDRLTGGCHFPRHQFAAHIETGG